MGGKFPKKPPPERRCRWIKKNGEQCENWALRGLNHCGTGTHTGAMNKEKGLRNWHAAQAEKKALKILERRGIPDISGDYLSELEKVVEDTVRWKNVCQDMIAELKAIRYESRAGGEQIRAEITLYERAMDRAAKLLVEIQKLNLGERRVRIDELTKDTLEKTIRAFLADHQALLRHTLPPTTHPQLDQLEPQALELLRTHLNKLPPRW